MVQIALEVVGRCESSVERLVWSRGADQFRSVCEVCDEFENGVFVFSPRFPMSTVLLELPPHHRILLRLGNVIV